MRLTRHARNKLRLAKLTDEDVRAVLAAPTKRRLDEKGNIVMSRGAVTVVVAGDDPDVIVTVWIERPR